MTPARDRAWIIPRSFVPMETSKNLRNLLSTAVDHAKSHSFIAAQWESRRTPVAVFVPTTRGDLDSCAIFVASKGAASRGGHLTPITTILTQSPTRWFFAHGDRANLNTIGVRGPHLKHREFRLGVSFRIAETHRISGRLLKHKCLQSGAV